MIDHCIFIQRCHMAVNLCQTAEIHCHMALNSLLCGTKFNAYGTTFTAIWHQIHCHMAPNLLPYGTKLNTTPVHQLLHSYIQEIAISLYLTQMLGFCEAAQVSGYRRNSSKNILSIHLFCSFIPNSVNFTLFQNVTFD